MNIYEWMRVVTRGSNLNPGDEVSGLNMIDALEKIRAFGTMSQVTEGHHQFVNGSAGWAVNKVCGFCGKPESEHEINE